MSYSIDPELVPWLPSLPAFDFRDVARDRRAGEDMLSQLPRWKSRQTIDTQDLMVPGPKGAPEVPVRIYSPAERHGLVPGLVYVHGGAFVTGSGWIFENDCIRLADDLGIVVVAPDYRLAPENPHPAGPEDCYAATVWAATHAADIGIDADRLGVGGESAGGGLSAAVALMARDRGGPALRFQWLGIPELDDRLETPSMIEFVDTPVWSRPGAENSWNHYLGPGRRGTADVPIYAAPSRCADLSGLPPAYVTACEFDPMRDEALIYAVRLIQAGVPTEVAHYPGTFHGSQMIDSTVSARMNAAQTDALRRGLLVSDVDRAS